MAKVTISGPSPYKGLIKWVLTQQQLIRIKQNFKDRKYKMIETNHQKFSVIGVSWLVSDPF